MKYSFDVWESKEGLIKPLGFLIITLSMDPSIEICKSYALEYFKSSNDLIVLNLHKL